MQISKLVSIRGITETAILSMELVGASPMLSHQLMGDSIMMQMNNGVSKQPQVLLATRP